VSSLEDVETTQLLFEIIKKEIFAGLFLALFKHSALNIRVIVPRVMAAAEALFLVRMRV